MDTMNTPQEAAWRGEFGDRYTDRNMGKVPANRAFFRKALTSCRWFRMDEQHSILELGCGAGENLQALRQLYPAHHLEGVEINPKAVAIARGWGNAMIHEGSVLDFQPTRKYDLVLSKGFCIHIPPTELARAYDVLVRSSKRWVLVAEYYSPRPVEIPYRNAQISDGMLWKRDFAGDLLNAYQELRLVDYGFVYHRDPYPQDDLTWFLMEKTQ